MEFKNEDINIRIIGDRRRGIWANLVAPRNARSTQTAGRIGTEASRHTLLAVALIAALRSISRRTIEQLQADPRKKLRIRVATLDADFGPAMMALLKKQISAAKIGKNFEHELVRLLRKFDVQFVNADNGALLALHNWANVHMFAENFIAAVPAAFRPVAASQLTPSHQL
jgi:hypothetical protein